MAITTVDVDVNHFSEAYVSKATQVILDPSPRYPWDDIVPKAVGQNTFRGFHRIDTSRSGAKEAFVGYFRECRECLVQSLARARSRGEMHEISNRVCNDARTRLSNCKQFQLRPYNKIRKPVDLYFEHLVAMAYELDGARAQVAPLLALPLDCQVLASPAIFTDEELRQHGLSRRSTYQDVASEQTYLALQELLAAKAGVISEVRNVPFHVIYFDLIWNGRFRRDGGNLFATNPCGFRASQLGISPFQR